MHLVDIASLFVEVHYFWVNKWCLPASPANTNPQTLEKACLYRWISLLPGIMDKTAGRSVYWSSVQNRFLGLLGASSYFVCTTRPVLVDIGFGLWFSSKTADLTLQLNRMLSEFFVSPPYLIFCSGVSALRYISIKSNRLSKVVFCFGQIYCAVSVESSLPCLIITKRST